MKNIIIVAVICIGTYAYTHQEETAPIVKDFKSHIQCIKDSRPVQICRNLINDIEKKYFNSK